MGRAQRNPSPRCAALNPSYESIATDLLRRVRQRCENSRPRTNALVKTPEIVFFVRRMDVVVFQTETDEHGIETEGALEIRDDRDRRARADQQRFLAPLVRQRALGSGQRL